MRPSCGRYLCLLYDVGMRVHVCNPRGTVQKAGLFFPKTLVPLVIKPLFKMEVTKLYWLFVVVVF